MITVIVCEKTRMHTEIWLAIIEIWRCIDCSIAVIGFE
jgi:hypothetical protein